MNADGHKLVCTKVTRSNMKHVFKGHLYPLELFFDVSEAALTGFFFKIS